MEESKELKNLYALLQGMVYLSIFVEALVFFSSAMNLPKNIFLIVLKFQKFGIYHNIFYSKSFTLLLIAIVSIGTRAQKSTTWNTRRHVVMPLLLGLFLFFGSVVFLLAEQSNFVIWHLTLFQCSYIAVSIIGAVMIQVGADNMSKHIKSRLMRDRFNVENESFEQTQQRIDTPQSVNIPMQFYHNQKHHAGFINIVNPFRGTLLLGTPGSGKSYSVVNEFIRQHSAKGFMLAVYDFKFPDLTHVTYANYLQNLAAHKIPANTQFHVINLSDVEYSKRVNPIKAEYIQTLADAQETAEALIEALKKGSSNNSSDQFFSQSAINFLSATIYFFAKHEAGKYSSFPHVMTFLNQSYDTIFKVLFTQPELISLLSPFKSAYDNRAFEQLEGQIGTLKIQISRLATKESFWVLSGDDVDLKITNPETPAYLIIANNPQTQNVNSACNTLILTRLVRLINTKNNLPCSLIIDEAPTLYFHRLENLMATARGNKVSTLLGLQELPQLKQQYGKDTADTICAICGNIISGSVRNKDTLDWLEKLFGKVKQIKESVSINRNNTTISQNENMDYLIPSAKIANLRTGELVAKIAMDTDQTVQNAYNCQVVLDMNAIQKEERQYRDIPVITDFMGEKEAYLFSNFNRIYNEVDALVKQITQK
jgi:type IV secretory pathway TraG/TraD family ATPase VirD4